MLHIFRDITELSSGARRFIYSECLFGIGIGIFSLVLNLHLISLGVNEAEIGRITSMGTLVSGILAIPFGLLANRFGRKKLLVLGLALMSVGYTLFAFGNSLPILYTAQFIQSVGLTLVITTEIQLIFHYCRTKKEETQSYSLLFAAFTLFMGVGTLLGGFLPKWLTFGDRAYQGALLVAAAALLLISIVRGVLLPKEILPVKSPSEETSRPRAKRNWLPSRPIWVLSFFIFMSGLTIAFIGPFLNIIVKFRFEWSDDWVSLLLMLNGFFLFVGSLTMPHILNRLGPSKALHTVFLINLIVTFLLFFTLPVGVIAVMLLMRGGVFILLTNMMESLSMSAVVDSERNLFAGIRTVMRSLGSSIATYIAGFVLAAKNYTLPFLLTAIAIGLAFIYFHVFVKPYFVEKNQETAES